MCVQSGFSLFILCLFSSYLREEIVAVNRGFTVFDFFGLKKGAAVLRTSVKRTSFLTAIKTYQLLDLTLSHQEKSRNEAPS